MFGVSNRLLGSSAFFFHYYLLLSSSLLLSFIHQSALAQDGPNKRTTGSIGAITETDTAILSAGTKPTTSKLRAKIKSRAKFGTLNGYDVDGGEAPICWSSQVPAHNEDDVMKMNDRMFGVQHNWKNQTIMMDQCYQGINFMVRSNNLSEGKDIYTDQTYSFRIVLTINLDKINGDSIINPRDGKIPIYLRLIFCNAEKTGFCSPLIDTRKTDKSWTITDTDLYPDLEHNEWSKSDNDSGVWKRKNKYLYNSSKPDVLKGMPYGSDIITRWVQWDLHSIQSQATDQNQNSPIYDTETDISIQISSSLSSNELGQQGNNNNNKLDGTYFVIAHAIVNLHTTGRIMDQRIDIADAIPNKLIRIRSAPVVMRPSLVFIFGLGFTILVFGFFVFVLCCFLIYHRKNTAVQLAQGPFLIWLLICSLMSTMSSVLYLPLNDWFCMLKDPCTLIPLSMSIAILCCRLWRVYVTVSSALAIGLNKSNKKYSIADLSRKYGGKIVQILTFFARFPKNIFQRNFITTKDGRKIQKPISIRSTATAGETVQLIILMTCPQIALQLFGVLYYDPKMETEMDSTYSIGRITCTRDGNWVQYLGAIYCGLLCLLATVLAWVSRDLPSAFNEKSKIYQAAGQSSIIAFIVVCLGIIMDSSTVSPDVTAFLWSIMTIGTVATFSFRVVMPIVKRVMSGEKVVMSSLLTSGTGSGGRSSAYSGAKTSTDFSTSDFDFHDSSDLASPEQMQFLELGQKKKSQEKIKLQKDDPVPRKIFLNIFKAQEIMKDVSSELADGRTLKINQWEELKENIENLQTQLARVSIEWTEDEEVLPSQKHATGIFASVRPTDGDII